MQVIVGKSAGFCYGVEKAVNATIKQLESNQEKQHIYCLGELVHNKQVIQKVENLGAKTIENLDEINEKENVKVIIRAHGVPPKIYKEAENKKYQILDLTCPNVLAIHTLAENASREGKYIFLMGHKIHPEVIGIYGCCEKVSVIENEEDIEKAVQEFKLSGKNKIQILSQTTFSVEKFNKYITIIQEKLKDRKQNIEVRNTICNATKQRQEETENLAKQVQYMIIIGGKNSSNTKKLYETAKSKCLNTVCIETAKELELNEIKKKREVIENQNKEFKIGIMAGASTPKESIEEVKRSIK